MVPKMQGSKLNLPKLRLQEIQKKQNPGYISRFEKTSACFQPFMDFMEPTTFTVPSFLSDLPWDPW